MSSTEAKLFAARQQDFNQISQSEEGVESFGERRKGPSSSSPIGRVPISTKRKLRDREQCEGQGGTEVIPPWDGCNTIEAIGV